MTQVIIQNLHLGGISDTKYSGLDNSAHKIENINIHEEPGVMKSQQAVQDDREGGTAVTEDVISIIHTAKGLNGYPDSSITYLFQDNGEVYRRNQFADYSSIFTTAEGNTRDAIAFNGWMFFTTSTEIGFFAAGDPDVKQNSLSTLQSKDPLSDKQYHPLGVVENKLYVGDGNRIHEISVSITKGQGQIASSSASVITGTGTDFNPDLKEGYVIRTVDGGGRVEERTIVANASVDTSATMNAGFTTNISTNTDYYIIKPLLKRDVLIIDSKLTAQVLSELLTNLVICSSQEGTSVGSYSGYSRIQNWDTRSIDLISDTLIPEFGVNAVMDFFGTPVIQAGEKGALYSYNGQRVQRFKRLPGDWAIGSGAIIRHRAFASYLGMPIFGVSNISGNPVKQGLYTVGGYDAKYPDVFNLEYVSDQSIDTSIGAVALIGEDLVFSSSKGGSEYVYRVDTSKKALDAFFETQIFNAGRDKLKNFTATICYRDIPAGAQVKLYQRSNDSETYVEIQTTRHNNRKVLESSTKVIGAANVQFKVEFNRGDNLNEAIEVESLIINFNTEQ